MCIRDREDGLQAVRKVEQTGPGYYDMIFMDIHMPVMDGFTATGEIRALQKNSAEHIPIIAMTADAFEEDVYKRQPLRRTGGNSSG